MTYSQQVQNMCPITKGPKHGPAPIPEEGAWVKAYEIKDMTVGNDAKFEDITEMPIDV